MSRAEHSAAGLLAARLVKRPRDLRRARRGYRELAFFRQVMAEVQSHTPAPVSLLIRASGLPDDLKQRIADAGPGPVL